ncbi:sulfotransferase [Flavobacteriaceae bacterium]|nr:sulfotransferase [Flavobacteriaceae bacterium]
MTNSKPNFLIVGAAKAGTTALYYYLKQHPDIGFPDLKEPKYFSSIKLNLPHKGIGDHSVDKYAVKDWTEYLNLFKSLTKYKRIGEVSPDYLFYHKETAFSIKRILGDIPIIIVLRNPIKRAFSAYMYLKRDSREPLTFKEGLDAEDERLENNWDFIWGYKKGGLYFEQVKTFFNTFSNVKVILQEDLKINTDSVIKELCSFLDVNPDFKLDTSLEHNPSGNPKNVIAKFLLNRNNKIATNFREFLKSVFPRSILENVASRSLEKKSISKSDQALLKNYFQEDITKLEILLNRDLSKWGN